MSEYNFHSSEFCASSTSKNVKSLLLIFDNINEAGSWNELRSKIGKVGSVCFALTQEWWLFLMFLYMSTKGCFRIFWDVHRKFRFVFHLMPTESENPLYRRALILNKIPNWNLCPLKYESFWFRPWIPCFQLSTLLVC